MIIKYFISAVFTLCLFNGTAQKKVIPVSQSALTGVILPAGSKQDKRLMTELAANILLEIESKNAKVKSQNGSFPNFYFFILQPCYLCNPKKIIWYRKKEPSPSIQKTFSPSSKNSSTLILKYFCGNW